MTWRSDSTQLVSGKWVSSAYSSHGITGAEIRSLTGSGGSGAGVLYNDWDVGDNASEFRYLIASYPSGGVFAPNEDGTFTFTAGDGTYTWTYQLYVNGVAVGSPATVTMTIGTTGAFSATLVIDDVTVSSSTFSAGTASAMSGAIVIDNITVNGNFDGGTASVMSASLVIDSFELGSNFSTGIVSTFTGSISIGEFEVSGNYSTVQPSTFSANLLVDSFSITASMYSVGAGGLDPTTPLGRVRLKIGDYSDLPILPDSVIYATLADYNNNVNRSSQVCAQYILGILTSRTHKRIAQLETWSGEQFSNYVQFLKLTVLNPNLTTVAPVPYAGNVDSESDINRFVKDWKDGYLAGSVVIPPQGAGRTIEYAY